MENGRGGEGGGCEGCEWVRGGRKGGGSLRLEGGLLLLFFVCGEKCVKKKKNGVCRNYKRNKKGGKEREGRD